MKKMRLQECITNILLAGLATAFLVHFALIVHYGGYYIQEPNPLILVVEIMGLFAVLTFATLNVTGIISDLRKQKSEKIS